MKSQQFIKKLALGSAMVAVLLTAQSSLAWSKKGHRVVGKLAELHLTDTTKAAILPLLDGDKLAEVTNWPDEMRSDPGEFWQKQSTRWHYINIKSADEFNPGHYHAVGNKAEVDNAYTAMLTAIEKLKSDKTPLAEKQFYFRFLTHLVGDIHQPMHVGRKDDRGGNLVKVKFFRDETNLHSLWDRGLVEYENLSFSEFADFIDTDNAELIAEYLDSQPSDWVFESFNIAKGLYNIEDGDFGYTYVYQHIPTVKTRLLQGGIRLAGLLNWLFDDSAKPLQKALKMPVSKNETIKH